MDTRTATEPVPVVDDLHLALATCASVQSSIQHADAKATVLLTLSAGVAALAANDLLAARAIIPHTVWLAAFGVAVCAALIGTLWHLGRCLRPRLRGPAGYNRFALVCLARQPVPPPAASAADTRDEAWRHAIALASIAVRKHSAVRSSMAWLALAVAAMPVLHWLVGSLST